MPLLIGYHLRQVAYGLYRGYPEILAQSAGIQSLSGISQRAVLWVGWLPNTYYEQSLFPRIRHHRARRHRHRGESVLTRPSPLAARGAVLFRRRGRHVDLHARTRSPVSAFACRRTTVRTGCSSPARRAEHPCTVASMAACDVMSCGVRRFWCGVACGPPPNQVGIAPLIMLMVAEGWFVGQSVQVPTALRLFIPPQAQVLDLPISPGFGNADAQYLAVLGNYRVVNGYSGYTPSHFGALRNALADHRPEAFEPFRRRADLYVVARPDLEPQFVTWLESLHDPQHLIDLGRWKLYRLPRLGDGPPPPPLLPLPQAGRDAADDSRIRPLARVPLNSRSILSRSRAVPCRSRPSGRVYPTCPRCIAIR